MCSLLEEQPVSHWQQMEKQAADRPSGFAAGKNLPYIQDCLTFGIYCTDCTWRLNLKCWKMLIYGKCYSWYDWLRHMTWEGCGYGLHFGDGWRDADVRPPEHAPSESGVGTTTLKSDGTSRGKWKLLLQRVIKKNAPRYATRARTITTRKYSRISIAISAPI